MTWARPSCSMTSGCGPRIDLVPIRAPALVPGPLVERHDERLPADVIPRHHQRVLVQCRRGPFAERVPHAASAEVDLPLEVAVQVVGIQPPRSEEREQVLTVGHGRTGCVGPVGLLVAFMGDLLSSYPFPDDLSCVAIERHHGESLRPEGLGTTGRSSAPTVAATLSTVQRPTGPVVRCHSGHQVTDRHRREHEDPVVPDDRRRRTSTWDLDFPGHVLRLAPLGRGIAMGREPGGMGAAPLAPKSFGVQGLRLRRDGPRQDDQHGHREPFTHQDLPMSTLAVPSDPASPRCQRGRGRCSMPEGLGGPERPHPLQQVFIDERIPGWGRRWRRNPPPRGPTIISWSSY